jgi:uncharacterized protein YifN (PemK superfamily)
MVHQREILSLYFPIPGRGITTHPGIVISNDDVFLDEGFFYCVMMSTKDYNPQYIHEITSNMVTKQGRFPSFAKCQMVNAFTEKDIEGRYGYLKIEYFDILKEKIIKSIF